MHKIKYKRYNCEAFDRALKEEIFRKSESGWYYMKFNDNSIAYMINCPFCGKSIRVKDK